MMWDLMLPECFSCFTIVSSEWERVIGGQRRERERFVGGGGRNLRVCDSRKEREAGAARLRLRECSVCVNVSACNWMRNGQWIK